MYSLLCALVAAVTVLASCSSDSGTNCNNTPSAPGCIPPPLARASITIFSGPRVVGDTTIGIATATTSRGSVLAEPTYNGISIAKAANPAVIEHAPAVGVAVYGARPIQAGANVVNALESTFTVAPINATTTIDKTSITLGESVRVTVPAQPGRDSVVVVEGSVRRASVLEGGGTISITPAAAGTTTITTTGFNGPVTQAGSTHTITVR